MFGRLSDIDLKLLRLFTTIVEAGGFSLATARLNISESTISQQMSDLEKRLGMRLCERGRSGFRLTKNGEEVYRATLDLLQDVANFRDRLAKLNGDISGPLNLGLPDAIITYPSRIFLDAISAYTRQSPNSSLNIKVLTPRELERAVVDSLLHVAIVPDHRRVGGLEYRPIARERNLLYCGEGHPFLACDPNDLTPASVEAADRIERGYFDGFEQRLFETGAPRATVHQLEAAALLILTGQFLGFLPAHYADSWVKRGKMCAVLPNRYVFDVAFQAITRRDGAEDPRVAAFLKGLIPNSVSEIGEPSQTPSKVRIEHLRSNGGRRTS